VISLSAVGAHVVALGPSWLDPQNLLQTFGTAGFWIAVGIIFAECGLLIGFFLPGDSLLFIVGLAIAAGWVNVNLFLALALLFIAALVGNICGYWIGARIGPALFRREDSRFFRKVYVERTHFFFEKYGARAIVLARFVPVVRTFITATAGVARMDFRKFVAFSALGALFWAVGVTLLGYWLGQVEFVSKNIELILILVVVISVVPLIIEFVRHRRQRGKA
jgi:membrane-associated protein